MLDGRFDPEFFGALADGRISASDLARDDEGSPADPVALKVLLAAIVAVIALCMVRLS